MKKSYKLFIFDFDGTLGDTKECVIASFQEALLKNNLPLIERNKIIYYIGLSLKEAFRRLTNDKLKDELYEKLVKDYRIFYWEFLAKKTLIFPEVEETLKRLKQKKALNSIATSKKTEFALLSCQYLHIDQYFDLYIGDDMVTQKKPNPEMLLYTLKKLNTNYKDAVMIGDSTFDVEMGKAINMDTIAVTWGAHSRKLLEQSGPTYIIDKFSELTKFI